MKVIQFRRTLMGFIQNGYGYIESVSESASVPVGGVEGGPDLPGPTMDVTPVAGDVMYDPHMHLECIDAGQAHPTSEASCQEGQNDSFSYRT